jgi:diguanylate cyclase (GGDEF)-like protein/PAS domain S-box-containing protein
VTPGAPTDARVRPDASAPTPPGESHAPRPAVLVLAIAVLLAARAVWNEGTGAELVFLVATVGAAAFAWKGTLRHDAATRGPWLLVAVGVSASALADVTYSLLTRLQGSEPDVSIADVFWLGSYVALAAGVVALEVRAGGGRVPVDTLLDVGAVAVVGLLVVWQISVSETLADPSVVSGVRLVWAAYPVLDAILLALVLHTVVDPRGRSTSQRLLAGGVVCWLVADLLYVTAAGIHVASFLDAGWMVGAVLLAAATWPRPARPRRGPVSEDDDGTRALRLLLIGLSPLLVPGLFELWGYSRGEDPDPAPLFLATLLLTCLAFVRAYRLVRVDRRLRARLRSSEHHYRALSANSSDAVVIIDEHGRLLNDATNLQALLGGWDADEDVDPFAWVAAEDVEEVARSFEKVLLSPGAVVASEVRYQRADGTTVWLASRAVNLLHDPDVGGIVINLHDITARKQLEEDLAHQAFHDSLTGLANRALLRDRLDQVFRRAGRTHRSVAVLYLDLDGFKAINDSLGHDAGDAVLREVASRLASTVRDGDTVARLGGDEFAVVTQESARCLDEGSAIAERILQALSAPIAVADDAVVVTASVGIAGTAAAGSVAEVLSDADSAMYRAKARGKNRIVLHEADMRGAASELLRLEADLAGALGRGELRLEYQPVVELDGERLVGFEALARWDHPELGLIAPDRFIPIAEENGTITELGAWVLREACAVAAGWRERHPTARRLTMAVNVSGRQLASRRVLADVRSALEATGLPARCLILEMTETALIEDADETTAVLEELRGLGVRLAIDDFGTGYSSLSYLRQFPVDILKIDRSFIATITDGQRIPAIVHGLIDLGHTLGLEVVAEGIERRAQQDSLRGEACSLGQGFLFARPLTPEQAEQALTADAAADA